MTEKIITWVEAWQGARKWSLHLFAMILVTTMYCIGPYEASFETLAWSVVALAGSFGASNGLEWIGKGKVTK